VELPAGPIAFGEVTITPDPEATAKLKNNSGLIISRVMWNSGGLNAKGTTVHALIMMANHDLEDTQIVGGPDWIKTEVFNIHAKATPTLLAAWPKMTSEQQEAAEKAMVRNLLATNFGFKAHQETKVEPMYALVVDNAAKLQAFDGECPKLPANAPPPNPEKFDPNSEPPCGTGFVSPGQFRGSRVEIPSLLRFLSVYSGRVVQDETGLKGRYDVNFKFTPDKSVLPPSPPLPPGMKLPEPDPNGPSLFDALVQQVGLRLVPQTGPLEMVVVDDAVMPGQEAAIGR
jgi:uncharacterized protein (TIGR03435 family)